MISDHLFDNLEDANRTILSSKLVSIFFPFLGKSVIVDSRINNTDGPVIFLTEMVKTPEERMASLMQIRPNFPKIEEIVLIPWVRYVMTLESSGIWENIVNKLEKLGHENIHSNADEILKSIIELEKKYLMAVIEGPYWETLWTKETI